MNNRNGHIDMKPQNDPAHFGNLLAVLSLLRCATLSQWFVMLYINWYGCDVYRGATTAPDSFYPRDEDPDTGDPLPFDDDERRRSHTRRRCSATSRVHAENPKAAHRVSSFSASLCCRPSSSFRSSLGL